MRVNQRSLRPFAFGAAALLLAGGAYAEDALPGVPERSASDLHVRPSAPGPGDGSEANPWNDLQHALEQLRPGDRLYLHGGAYIGPFNVGKTCRDGTAEAPITVFAQEDGQAVFHGNAEGDLERPVLEIRRAGWRFYNLEIVSRWQGPTPPGGDRHEGVGLAVRGRGARDILLFHPHLRGGARDGLVVGTEVVGVTIHRPHIHNFVNALRVQPGAQRIRISDGFLHDSEQTDLVLPDDRSEVVIVGNPFEEDDSD